MWVRKKGLERGGLWCLYRHIMRYMVEKAVMGEEILWGERRLGQGRRKGGRDERGHFYVYNKWRS